MSVVVVRAQAAVGQLVHVAPQAQRGADVYVGVEEVAVVCAGGEVVGELAAGRHALDPPGQSAHLQVFFVTIDPIDARFEGAVGAVQFHGTVSIQVRQPRRLVHEVIALPADGLASGILRSVSRSVVKTLSRAMVREGITGLSPRDLGRLVDSAARANPLAGAVAGLGLYRFEELTLRIGEDVAGWSASAEMAGERDSSGEIEIPRDRSSGSIRLPPGGPPGQSNSSGGIALPQPEPLPRQTLPHGTPTVRAVPAPAPPPRRNSSSPETAIPEHTIVDRSLEQRFAAQNGTDHSLSDQTVPDARGLADSLVQHASAHGQPLPAGANVLVYWVDGLWHAATVRQFHQGQYEVVLDNATVAWVQSEAVRAE